VAEHFGVGQRALNVYLGKPLVKAHRGGVTLHKLGHGLGKAARPGLIFFVQRICHGCATLWEVDELSHRVTAVLLCGSFVIMKRHHSFVN